MSSLYECFHVTAPRTIRLLVPQNRQDGLLSFCFSVACLDDAPRYAALSYVWGSPEFTERIVLEGSTRNVTPNLINALERVHHAFQQQPDNQIPLWADQLCINQDDIEEREQQVSMMDLVYLNAESVMVCLGDSTTAGDVASIITELGPRVNRDLEGYGSFDAMPGISHQELTSLNLLNWSAFREMMQTSWFSRAWVVQEVGLAREAIVLYGNCSFKWWELMSVLDWLSIPAGRLRTMNQLSGWTTRVMWQSFDMKSRNRDNSLLQFGVLDLLSHAAYRYDATNARDYIYAFLGHPSFKKSSLVVKPDYKSSINAVFTQFATSWLEYSKQPYLFSCVNHATLALPHSENVAVENGKDILPSWCPNWGFSPLGGTRMLSGRADSWYSASKAHQFYFRRLPDNLLQIKGFLYDTVERVFDTLEEIVLDTDRIFPKGSFNSAEIAIILKLADICWKMLESTREPSYSKNTNLEDAIFPFVSTINTGMWWGGDVFDHRQDRISEFKAFLIEARQSYHPETEAERFKVALDGILSTFLSAKVDTEAFNPPHFVGDSTRPTTRFYSPEGQGLRAFNPPQFLGSIQTVIASRRLFLTNRGHVGLGPEIVAKGDSCCVISGAQVPFILRPVNASKFLLVGECFVHDIMHGEAVNDREKAGVEWDDLVLQ